MSALVLKVESLCKRFRIGSSKPDNITQMIWNQLRSWMHFGGEKNSETWFWALKGISFEVRDGEILGIIGPNGSGKSTLLKILSEVTFPSQGRIEIRGKVAAILEVGAGFHPDLSGRENIFLNGKLHGMKRNEVEGKLQEIISFSGVSEFIDMPVKHYSSGMYMRLAFSVVAFLDADVMIFDEVISVGDLEFRLKCLKKIKELARSGKTILLVSHNMNEVMNICSRVMLLEKGQIKAIDYPGMIVSDYIEKRLEADILQVSEETLTQEESVKSEKNQGDFSEHESERSEKSGDEKKMKILSNRCLRVWSDSIKFPANSALSLQRVCVRSLGKSPGSPIYMNDSILIEIEYFKNDCDSQLDIAIQIVDQLENPLFGSTTLFPAQREQIRDEAIAGNFQANCTIPGGFFNKGWFFLDVFCIRNGEELVMSEMRAVQFKVNLDADKAQDLWQNKFPGPLRPLIDWNLKAIDTSG